MASELAQLESRTTDIPQAEAEPEKEDVDFEFNGNVCRAKVNFIAVLRSLPTDEKDVFGSDFESTEDEEEAGGDEERDSIAERYIQEEERRMRRVRISKHWPIIDLTVATTTLRKRKRSWSGQQP